MCRYHTISARLIDIAHLLGCLRMLPLHDVTLDDVSGEFNNVSARASARLLIPCFTLFASKKVPVNGRSPERSRC